MGTHKSDSQQARPPLWLPCAIAVATYLVLHFSEPVGPRKSPTAANRAILLVGFGLVWSCFAALWTQTAAAAASGFSETPDPVSILPQARAILTSSAVYFASLITSVICYRISPLHPLAGVPGPFWYKTSKLFGAWIAWKGKTHLLSKKWHDTYGPIVRTGPNEISILDAEAIPAVLGTGGLSKGQFYDGRWDPNAPAGSLLILKDEDHASRRRLWTRGMSSQALKEYEGFIGNRANILIEKLEAMAGAGSSVDIAEWISYFTFDFMGDMAFGFDFEFLRNAGDKDGLLGAMRRFAIAVQVVCHIPWVATYANKIPMFGRDMQILRAFGVGAATRRVKVGASSKDLWYHLTDEAGFEKSKPSIASVVADGTLAIVAGADTTVSALSSLFYFLLSDPTCYKRLQQEVDAVYPPGSDPLDVSKHAELVFMNGCLNEALRLQPPVPTNGPRQVPVDSGGRMISGHFFPPGTQIFIPPYSLHRDPRYFSPLPNEFMPDRWLDSSKSPNAGAFIPFSYGPANCVGKVLARQEMLMVCSALLQKFEFCFAEEFRPESWSENLRDYFVTTRGPLLVKVQVR